MADHIDLMSPELYAEIAEGEVAFVRTIKAKVHNGEPLTVKERCYVEALLDARADTLPRTMPRKSGRPPAFNHGEAQLAYRMQRMAGKTHRQAIDHVLTLLDDSVSQQALEQILSHVTKKPR